MSEHNDAEELKNHVLMLAYRLRAVMAWEELKSIEDDMIALTRPVGSE